MLLSSRVYAHSAHEHGIANINIAVDKNGEVEFQFEAPAISVYGFEHEANSKKEKSNVNSVVKDYQKNFFKYVQFSKKAQCNVMEHKINAFVKEAEDNTSLNSAELKAEHGNFEAITKLNCKQLLELNEIKFFFKKVFPAIQNMRVQLITENTQRQSNITSGNGMIQL